MEPVIQIMSMGEKTKPYVEHIRALRKKIESEEVRFEDIRAIDKSTNVTFNLTQDQSKIIKHFERKERRKK
jgi:hypothetical protein